MSGLSRLAIAAALVAGLGSLAQAQPRSAPGADAGYVALATGRSATIERPALRDDAAVTPSYSQTVMGLSVPR